MYEGLTLTHLVSLTLVTSTTPNEFLYWKKISGFVGHEYPTSAAVSRYHTGAPDICCLHASTLGNSSITHITPTQYGRTAIGKQAGVVARWERTD